MHNTEKGMKPLRLSEVADLLDGELVGAEDPVITGVASIEQAGPGDLTFLSSKRHGRALAASGAAAVIVGPDLDVDRPAVRVSDPYGAFASFLERLLPDRDGGSRAPHGLHSRDGGVPRGQQLARQRPLRHGRR